MKNIIENSHKNSYSYLEYRKKVSDLLAEGKSSGNEQSEDLLHYSQLNEVRMNRLDKTIVVPEEVKKPLQALRKKYLWLVLAEGWCGDAAQLLPIMEKMTEMVATIDLRIVFRDENDALMQEFLTNGARSIPKLIILNADNHEVLAAWGPRPEAAARLIKEYKAKFGVVNEEAKTELQKWYLHDKGLSTMAEIVKIMQALE
ncbi:thioredoxin family protein [Flavobacterium suncheonense]|uniref:Thioredoxin n=1 Tax=Flavobacterium suncheonense GH29-5 = DSM 17707 TaxID=1121899 RepID=A0A0A2MCN8_9FLAO|nr:thioredoxin family protein [Flavobacterium suncheonense]KGO90452.1 thioredoxin [Flavobacterium suncheonense GH29-5 = DSM 17707]